MNLSPSMPVVEFKDITTSDIKKDRIESLWKNMTKKPMPRITAYLVWDKWEEAKRTLYNHFNTNLDMKEYGRVPKAEETIGCVFRTEDGYWILIRAHEEVFWNGIKNSIFHELRHILKEEV